MRYYDQPATPLKRVLESAEKTPQINVLQSMAKNTDLFELSRQIDQRSTASTDYQPDKIASPGGKPC
jgi:hypothetical protein